MTFSPDFSTSSGHFSLTIFYLIIDCLRLLPLGLLPKPELQAKVLILEKQLSMYKESGIRPRRAIDPERISIALLAKLIPSWASLMVVVHPDTVCRWHSPAEALPRTCVVNPRSINLLPIRPKKPTSILPTLPNDSLIRPLGGRRSARMRFLSRTGQVIVYSFPKSHRYQHQSL